METTTETSAAAQFQAVAESHLADVTPALVAVGGAVLAVFIGIFVYRIIRRFV